MLDDRSEWPRFGRALTDRPGSWESYLAIGGMHCAACALAVEQALGRVAGVVSVEVDGATATARVVWAHATCRPSQWFAALDAAGYAGMPAGDLLDAAPRARAQRRLLWQWLVAGFGMMQAMMYSVPLYLAACVLEAAVFAVVDPHDLRWGGGPLGWSRQAVYTVSFFLFWVVCLGSSLLALVLARTRPVPALRE